MSQSVEWIFDSALSHTRRSDAVEIRVDTLAQIRLATSFESSLVSVKLNAVGIRNLRWCNSFRQRANLKNYLYKQNVWLWHQLDLETRETLKYWQWRKTRKSDDKVNFFATKGPHPRSSELLLIKKVLTLTLADELFLISYHFQLTIILKTPNKARWKTQNEIKSEGFLLILMRKSFSENPPKHILPIRFHS